MPEHNMPCRTMPCGDMTCHACHAKRGRPCHATWICRECRAKLCHDKPRHDHAHLIHSCLRSRPGFCGPDFLFCYGPIFLCPFGAMIEQDLLRNYKEWRSPPRKPRLQRSHMLSKCLGTVIVAPSVVLFQANEAVLIAMACTCFVLHYGAPRGR